MPPSSYLSIYQEYKRDTDIVASWLATTAKERGYTDSLAGPGTTSGAAKSGRLKGKARKAAKQQKTPTVAAAKEGSDPSPKSKYVLAIRDFVPLAKFIASNLTTTPVEDNNTAGIPSFFSTALDRAIQVRKKFSSLLKDAGESLSAQADKTHEHFITILEKVRTVFLHVDGASGMESTNDSTKNANDKSGAEAKFFNFNLFETLRVYEPSEDFLNSSDAVHPAASLPIDLEYTTESDMSETECMLALTALFKDFINLREEINSLWNEYRTGKIDLAAAAVGVNLAIELARSLEEDIAPLLESHGGSTEVLPHYYGMVCESMDLDFSEKERPSDDMNFECYNRWAQEKAALLEVASDIAMLTEFKGIPVIDEFARGIKHMFESREIPIWLCFAAQNYLDTLHFFGPDIKKGVAEFDRFNATTTQRLDRIIGSVESDAKKIIGNMRDMLKVKKDGYDIFTVARIAANGIDRPSSFFLHNPLFCGLWINYVRMNFHQNGVVYAAKPGALLHTVQLYTAVRQHQQEHSVPVVEWPDLDRVIDMQGHQAFFVGGEPTTSPEAHFKNYCMSRSVSPTNWLTAAKRRKGKGGKVDMAKSRAGVRELKLKSPLSRYTGSRSEKHGRVESARRSCNTALIHEILETSDWFKLEQEEQAESQDGAATDGKGKVNKAATARTMLTPPQLVHYVSHGVQREIPDLDFDYFVMHHKSRALLEKVRENAVEISPQHTTHFTGLADYAGLVFAIEAQEMESKSGQSEEVLDKVAIAIDECVAEE
ncbi:hypothetical protein FSST1_003018 [Fusarium sambucinum]